MSEVMREEFAKQVVSAMNSKANAYTILQAQADDLITELNRKGILLTEEPPVAASEGRKFDTGKVRLDLLSVPALTAVAQVMTFGARKYGDNNWRGGMGWSRLVGAGMRHLFAFISGEDTDPESGLPHLAHALCCLMFLLEYQLTENGTDDRYRRNPK